jgi:hypothetical protein
VRVVDDIHNQSHTGTDLWQGDSIQVSFDPEHEKTEGAYGPHDVELGFALASESRKLLSCAYVPPNKAILDHTRFQVVRNETDKTTIYEVAIPFADFDGFASRAGTLFGFNIAVQDADRIFSREHCIEFTEGTSVKNPANYRDWTLLQPVP